MIPCARSPRASWVYDFDEPLNTTVISPDQAAGLQRQAETARLGDAITELASRIQAATYQLLVLIHQFDEREGWGEGFNSCAHWLNWRTGLAMGAAREKVRGRPRLAGYFPHGLSRGIVDP